MNMLIRFYIMMTLLQRELDNTQQGSLSQAELFKPFERTYRVLPHDMGFRHHLPNYRYLSFIELNITGWLTKCQHIKGRINGSTPKKTNKNTAKNTDKLSWILAMQEMVYLKEIMFLDKMTVTSTLEGWDGKYIYFQHHFFVKNTIKAIGLSKFLLMDKQGQQFSPEVLDMTGEHLTDVINTWNANQTAIKQQ